MVVAAKIEDLSFDPITKLHADIKQAAKTLSPKEARYLVDMYYIFQDNRIRAAHQVRMMEEEPSSVIDWVETNNHVLENNVKSALDVYSGSHPAGQWIKSIYGIGPVIAAGLLAHIDMDKTHSPSALWRFAGLDPTVEWKKGQKRPWNARLKVICWKAGESFKKFSNRDECYYGKIYRERKELEVERNEAGLFADQAKATLERVKIGKSTPTYAHYKEGRLPPGRLDLRAMRYATKILLSHYWAVAYQYHFGRVAPNAWILEHGGHVHPRPIPNWEPITP